MTQKELVEDLERDVLEEFQKETENVEQYFNNKEQAKVGIMQRIYWTIFGKLFKNFKIKITLYYKDSVLFEYEFPKD